MNIFSQFVNTPLMKIFLTMSIAVLVITILPQTPFMSYLRELAGFPYLGYLNWVIPVGTCAGIMAAWWTAVVVFYAARWILSQLNLIG